MTFRKFRVEDKRDNEFAEKTAIDTEKMESVFARDVRIIPGNHFQKSDVNRVQLSIGSVISG